MAMFIEDFTPEYNFCRTTAKPAEPVDQFEAVQDFFTEGEELNLDTFLEEICG